jgi:hypothetical protein
MVRRGKSCHPRVLLVWSRRLVWGPDGQSHDWDNMAYVYVSLSRFHLILHNPASFYEMENTFPQSAAMMPNGFSS